MRFLIITHVQHKSYDNKWYGYAPYINEMNLWLKYATSIEVVAPISKEGLTLINEPYKHANLYFNKIPSIAFNSFGNIVKSTFKVPIILTKIFLACKRADHIHLRCPGNIGLLGVLVQVLFPKKVKTAKYAGNWDPFSKQPLSYRFQKKLLSSAALTKNMSVLVYGNWSGQTKNIKPFFTATYNQNEIEKITPRDYSKGLKFMFSGSLVEGKRPLLSIKIIEILLGQGKEVSLEIFGDGVLRTSLETYVSNHNLNDKVKFWGNQSRKEVKEALKTSHFLLLPSKSEGWPKAVAEAMFFGVIPISTRVSCVPFMVDEGNRGILIEPEVGPAVSQFNTILETKDLNEMSELACEWSQYYTLDYFESEIKKMMLN